jgi:hypothetical protein
MRRKRRENDEVEELQITPFAPEAVRPDGSIRPEAHLHD